MDEQLAREILEVEWDMFRSVQNIGGPAECQQDHPTFEIMRASQLESWTDEIGASYLDDLRGARNEGRNLMAEKYARMMERTSPAEFERVAASLPRLDDRALPLIDRLTEMSVRWAEELRMKYPFIGGQGRPLRSSMDSGWVTSLETYSRGELATYSLRTLQLLDDHYRRMATQGVNLAEVVLRVTAERYGFDSLEKAEAAQKARTERERGL